MSGSPNRVRGLSLPFNRPPHAVRRAPFRAAGQGEFGYAQLIVLAWYVAAGLTTVTAASPAFAHTGAIDGGLVGGLLHPVFGPDHVAAMVAVGLWGAFLGPPAIYLLPIVFPLLMAAGGVLGILGVPLPGVEFGIAISAIVLGMMVALAAVPPLWFAGIIVGAFAIFHGHAHGVELPAGADAVAYSAGFVIATGLLHLAGVAFGLLARWPGGRLAVRTAGGTIAIVGLMFLGRLT